MVDRPIFGRAATDNIGSIRGLQKDRPEPTPRLKATNDSSRAEKPGRWIGLSAFVIPVRVYFLERCPRLAWRRAVGAGSPLESSCFIRMGNFVSFVVTCPGLRAHSGLLLRSFNCDEAAPGGVRCV